MIELLIFVAGVIAIIVFRESIKLAGKILEGHSQVWAEDQLVNVADKRQEVNKRVDELVAKHKGLVSHEEIMGKLGMK